MPTIRSGYDPRRSAFTNDEGGLVATTREKELQREAWRDGLVKRAEERAEKAKEKGKK